MSADRRVKLHPDALNMVHRNAVAKVAIKAASLVEPELPAAQIHGSAVLFLAICERLGANPRDALSRAERMLASRHEDFDKTANIHFAALADFIDHCNDPKRALKAPPNKEIPSG